MYYESRLYASGFHFPISIYRNLGELLCITIIPVCSIRKPQTQVVKRGCGILALSSDLHHILLHEISLMGYKTFFLTTPVPYCLPGCSPVDRIQPLQRAKETGGTNVDNVHRIGRRPLYQCFTQLNCSLSISCKFPFMLTGCRSLFRPVLPPRPNTFRLQPRR